MRFHIVKTVSTAINGYRKPVSAEKWGLRNEDGPLVEMDSDSLKNLYLVVQEAYNHEFGARPA